METALQQLLESWLADNEDEHLEFKAATGGFHFEELVNYAVALANEGGGKIIFGVSDRRPRRVTGTAAFPQPEMTRTTLYERLKLAVRFDVIAHPDGRVLVFHVPSRPIGLPVQSHGVAYARNGDSLVVLSEQRRRQIYGEAGHDFSADACERASASDLDDRYIEDFRGRWVTAVTRAEKFDVARQLQAATPAQVLADAGLVNGGAVTYAALILFGTRGAFARHLAPAEVIFEYRSSDASGPPQDRGEFRHGFFGYYDELWNAINLRNDRQNSENGLFVTDIRTFSERPVREAVLNAIAHRNYQLGGSVIIRQYARRLEVDSPGGLPFGVTVANIIDRTVPRNRLLASAFALCGLVERSGQGMNLIYESSIRQGKPLPDFDRTDDHQVGITLFGNVRDPQFVRFLERVGERVTDELGTHDWLVLDRVARGEKVGLADQSRANRLVELGIVEQVRSQRYMLSRRYYSFVGQKGVYTRKRGLDRDTNKALLLKHLQDNPRVGSPLQELMQVLPSLSREQVQSLMTELRQSGNAHFIGVTRAARWFPGPGPNAAEEAAIDKQ